jgi:hypothetical protein
MADSFPRFFDLDLMRELQAWKTKTDKAQEGETNYFRAAFFAEISNELGRLISQQDGVLSTPDANPAYQTTTAALDEMMTAYALLASSINTSFGASLQRINKEAQARARWSIGVGLKDLAQRGFVGSDGVYPADRP